MVHDCLPPGDRRCPPASCASSSRACVLPLHPPRYTPGARLRLCMPGGRPWTPRSSARPALGCTFAGQESVHGRLDSPDLHRGSSRNPVSDHLICAPSHHVAMSRDAACLSGAAADERVACSVCVGRVRWSPGSTCPVSHARDPQPKDHGDASVGWHDDPARRTPRQVQDRDLRESPCPVKSPGAGPMFRRMSQENHRTIQEMSDEITFSGTGHCLRPCAPVPGCGSGGTPGCKASRSSAGPVATGPMG